MTALVHSAIRSVTFALCLLALGGCNPATRSAADDEAAVARALQDACDAFLKADVDRMMTLLTEDFTTTDPDGVVTTRADDIESARKGTIRYEVFENRDMKVRLHGDAAVVTGRTIVKGQAGERTFAAEFQFTDTLVRTGERWLVAATHISRVPK
jgi:ketosteroid isomerase-like protein